MAVGGGEQYGNISPYWRPALFTEMLQPVQRRCLIQVDDDGQPNCRHAQIVATINDQHELAPRNNSKSLPDGYSTRSLVFAAPLTATACCSEHRRRHASTSYVIRVCMPRKSVFESRLPFLS